MNTQGHPEQNKEQNINCIYVWIQFYVLDANTDRKYTISNNTVVICLAVRIFDVECA